MSDYKRRNKYFASDDSEACIEYLQAKSEEWFNSVQSQGYLDKVKRSWAAYHGMYYEDPHAISFGGEQGELVNLAVNHYGNLAQHMLIKVTSTRPTFQCRAVNSDRKSLIQAKLGNGLLDYYMREKRLERTLRTAVEHAIVMGSGYIKMEWNATRGTIYDYVEPDPSSIVDEDEDGNPIDENGNIVEAVPIYEGEAEFTNLSTYDVFFDSTKENPSDHEWIVCRSFANRYNLAKKYPHVAEELLAAPSKTDVDSKIVTLQRFDETEDIPIYEFFHKKTESVEDGRYILYAGDGIALEDSILIYDDIPVFRIAPRDILGTPFGYTSMFDLLPLQDVVNSLHSTIMTNINAFSVSNVLNPQGNNVKVNQLEGTMNFIEYNAQVGKPELLNLTKVPQDVYNYVQMAEKSMETLSGISSIARGNPEPGIESGNALALIESQSLQFMSGLQQSYIQLLEDVGTGLINLLKKFADVPRVAAISGLANTSKMEEFKSDDLEGINRVVVDVGNALMNSTAGRAQIAENLLTMGVITTPEKYLEVLHTGSLDSILDGVYNELDTIKSENEGLVRGEPIIAIATDNHALHIREHREVLSDHKLRQDAELVQRTLDHMMEHINLLQTTDPNLLGIVGQQPLGPPAGSPVAPGNVAPPGMAPGAQGSAPMAGNLEQDALQVGGGQPQNLPSPATPPGEFADAPMTGEQLMVKNTQG